ncbi:MAG: hypothetical protein IPL25_17960 [Saprospiraceae bacterium]|nr:hypothetical protein [Candidatus Vicinibacter affinis]
MTKIKTIHTSRTMIYTELEKVMAYSLENDNFLKSLGQNVTGKKSNSGVEKTANYLKRLYGFDMQYSPFVAFKYFWKISDPNEKPLIAFVYAVNKDDLLAESVQFLQSVKPGVKSFNHLIDKDGIFCIPSDNTEHARSERLRDYLQQVFVREWINQTITLLLQIEGAKSTNLEAWLLDVYFVQHCKVFQNRPFIWHIWDGHKDGFSALVNHHKLDKDNLSKLTYTYLNDWIHECVAKKNAGESSAEGLLSAAQKLKENLEAILHGEAPYDIFVRWKPLEQQPIGWEPDLNDGVRLNIRPFVEAGVLRSKFNVKWGVDIGKNPPGSP